MAVRAREIALLTDPAAGRGGAAPRVRDVAAARLRDAGFAVRVLDARHGDEATDLARAAVEDGVEAVVVCGDDRWAHHAVQALAGTDVALGLVPVGARDDVARLLGVPLRDPRAATDRVVASRTRRIDLGRVGQHWFVTALTAGPTGPAALLAGEARTCTLDLDGAVRRTAAVSVSVANAPARAGGWRLHEDAVADDGLLDVVVVRPAARRRAGAAYARLVRGTVDRLPEVERHRAARVTVAVTGPTAWADGVHVGPLPLTVECVPGALRVLA